jgi:two-component system, LytTR family, sensor kinase
MNPTWLKRTLYFGLWTLVGLLFSTQWYITSTIVGPPITWFYAFTWVMTDWYAWGALAPFVIALGRRYPIDQATWRAAIAIHLAAAVGFALVHPVLFALATYWTPPAQLPAMSFWTLLANLVAKKCLTNIVTYAAILGVGHVFEYYGRFRERELRASQLEGQLVRARLRALEMQLRPHFLFNTLNTVSELIHSDPRAADRMVARLGDMLRATLDGEGGDEVPLRRELEHLDRYLDIERTRFRDRLRVEVEADADALDAAVPKLFLQPIVENALRHGIGSRPGPGSVAIRASRQNGRLVILVRDDGPGLANGSDSVDGAGIGLSNTRARIEQLYGRDAELSLRNVAGGGAEVSMKIPYRSVAGDEG